MRDRPARRILLAAALASALVAAAVASAANGGHHPARAPAAVPGSIIVGFKNHVTAKGRAGVFERSRRPAHEALHPDRQHRRLGQPGEHELDDPHPRAGPAGRLRRAELHPPRRRRDSERSVLPAGVGPQQHGPDGELQRRARPTRTSTPRRRGPSRRAARASRSRSSTPASTSRIPTLLRTSGSTRARTARAAGRTGSTTTATATSTTGAAGTS